MAFLDGTGRDHRGRSIADVLAFDDEQLEHVHDYVQWLFPLPTASGANEHAPVLTAGDIAVIRASAAALANFKRAIKRMMKFYATGERWLRAQDHNHLRITRILKSARMILGLREARRLYDLIRARNLEFGEPVNRTSVAFWDDAISGP